MSKPVVLAVLSVLMLLNHPAATKAQRAIEHKPGWIRLSLDAPKLMAPMKSNEDPGCYSSVDMGQLMDRYLQEAQAAGDGAADDSTWAGTTPADAWFIDIGGRRYSLYATCRIFAVLVPVPLSRILQITTQMHIDGTNNGADKVCHPLQLRQQDTNWILEGKAPYPTPFKVGCSGGYSLFETFKAIDLPNGKGSVIGAVFKNWSHDTMRTGQLIIAW